MGKYAEFSIESALNTKPVRTGYKLNGMRKFAAITVNPSRSTEEFISGAISCLGQADRTIMYTTMALEALDDRLALAAKIAKPVNQAKYRGVEGFNNVSYLNPWEYAIEGKAGDFFKKIWDAILTIAAKIWEAIQNFVRWLGNAINGVAVKLQAKDYKKWKELSNKEDFKTKIKNSKVDDIEIKTLPWDFETSSLSDKLENFDKQYKKMNKDVEVAKIMTAADGVDLKDLKDKESITAAFNKIFGGDPKQVISTISNNCNNLINELKYNKSNRAYNGANPREYVKANVLKGDGKITQMKLSVIKDMSGDFSVLDNAWITSKVSKLLANVHEEEKTFANFHAKIKKIATKFEKSESINRSAENSISKNLATLAKLKCTVNSCYNTAAIEYASYAFRFCKTCHIALKAYLRAGDGKKTKEAKKSGESLQSIESMFAFD